MRGSLLPATVLTLAHCASALRPPSSLGSTLAHAAQRRIAVCRGGRGAGGVLGLRGGSLEREFSAAAADKMAKNVLGGALQCCCTEPKTGFYRDGFCTTGAQDVGIHVVCAQVTEEWLQFSKARGNDLITPKPMYNFPGLKPGDKWCLCASRWKEAYDAGCAPPVVLEACHEKALEAGITLESLKAHALKQ